MGGLGRSIRCGMLDLKEHMEMIIFWHFVVKVLKKEVLNFFLNLVVFFF